MPRIYFLLFLLFLAASCKKYEEETVPSNIAPPDNSVSSITIEHYINKVYISVLGRKPDSAENTQSFSLLSRNSLSPSSRSEFLNTLFLKEDYFSHLYEITRQDLLDNMDTALISERIYVLDFLLITETNPLIIDILKYEKNRFLKMQTILPDLMSGNIDIIEMQRRCVDNNIYDEINMGTENFVLSVFTHFLFRSPTGYPSDSLTAGKQTELNSASAMVDGKNSLFFFQAGSSKEDFLNIFFNSNDYFEGQVRYLYLRYLFRNPSSAEMTGAAIKYKNSKNYIEMQKEILSSDEYTGIK